MSFLSGDPGKFYQKNRLGPEQMQNYQNLQGAAQGTSNAGAAGQAGQYYRGLLSNDSEDFNAFAAPELRRFREQTEPGIANDFARYGAGSLSSSGYRNARLNAQTDLSERLGAIRAQLRQQGAQGLMNLSNQSLGDYNQNFAQPQTGGFSPEIGSLLGSVAGSFIPGVGTALGGLAGRGIENLFKRKNKSQDYNYGQGLSNSGSAGPAF